MPALTPDDLEIVRLAKEIVETPSRIVPILNAVGMTATRFGRRAAEVWRNPIAKNTLSKATLNTLKAAVRIVGPEAVTAATTAGMTLLRMIPMIIGGLLVLGGVLGAGYMYHNWGKPDAEPVKAGPRGDPNAVRPEAGLAPKSTTLSPPVANANSYPHAITVLHKQALLWPTKLNLTNFERGEYKGTDFEGNEATATLRLGEDGSFSLTISVAKKGYVGEYSGKKVGNLVEGRYKPSSGFGPPDYFKADLS